MPALALTENQKGVKSVLTYDFSTYNGKYTAVAAVCFVLELPKVNPKRMKNSIIIIMKKEKKQKKQDLTNDLTSLNTLPGTHDHYLVNLRQSLGDEDHLWFKF